VKARLCVYGRLILRGSWPPVLSEAVGSSSSVDDGSSGPIAWGFGF
jgi:hypothetical protein